VTEADILGLVLEIISDRTGYPIDMIEPDLDSKPTSASTPSNEPK